MTINGSLIFLLVVLALNLFFGGDVSYAPEEARDSGGPIISLADYGAVVYGSTVYSPADIKSFYENEPNIIEIEEEGLVFGSGRPLSNVSLNRNGLITYKVLAGDTISSIAAKFGISIETLKTANPALKNFIKPGQELLILPVSGLIYQVRDGDTVEDVLGRYQVNFELFKRYNPGYQEIFSKGKTVILPYAVPPKDLAAFNRYVSQGLPDLGTYFALPARGWNWGELHDFNAVDIAGACGHPIYASAEGLVIEESGSNHWNDGYGNFVLIEHPNGTKTKYGHTLRNLVTVGDYVAQGDQIALIGSTGNVHGPTGCHLHFEVYGAKNPFAIR